MSRVTIQSDDDEVFMVVEKMPEFTYKKRKGAEAIFKFINEKVNYPAIAKEYNITGILSLIVCAFLYKSIAISKSLLSLLRFP